MEETLLVELEALLDEAATAIAEGDNDTAQEKISEAKGKLRPVGSGTNGLEPQN